MGGHDCMFIDRGSVIMETRRWCHGIITLLGYYYCDWCVIEGQISSVGGLRKPKVPVRIKHTGSNPAASH